MRQIKFRIYDKKEKTWLFGYKECGGFSILGEIVMLGELSSIHLTRLNDLDVMQFTGLLDKNKKEAYEKDIIRLVFDTLCGVDSNGTEIYETTEEIGVVEFKDGEFVVTENKGSIWENCSLSQLPSFEVIGDIYQNPELL